MLTIIGATLVAGTSTGFWYLLPRNGKVNPLVRNPGVGSIVTVAILIFDYFITALWGV